MIAVVVVVVVEKEKNDKYASSVHTSNRMPFIHCFALSIVN